MLKTTGKRIGAIAVIIAVIISTAVVFASIVFPNARLGFSGFTVQNGANGHVQGFVEVRLRNIEALGTEFTIKYDPKYVVPSNVITNEALTGADDVGLAFAQNTDNFPIVTHGSEEINCFDSENFGEINDTANTVRMRIVPLFAKNPEKSPLTESEYGANIKLGTREGEGYYIDANTSRGLALGRMSFQIVDPAGISMLTKEQLKDVIHINMLDEETSEAFIMYYDPEEEREDFYYTTEYVEYDWSIETKIISAQPVNPDATVSAAQIYNDGSENDLIDYLNANMRYVILTYSNGGTVRDKIIWGDTDKGFTIDKPYNVKGDTYRVRQQYNDELTVEAVITVTPVELVGYSVDNVSITYPANALPAVWEDLQMPETAAPILSERVDKFIIPNVAIEREDWTPSDIPNDMITGVATKFDFTALPKTDTLQKALPWLTIPDDITADVVRYIGEVTSAPTEVTASTDRVTGVMTINVKSLEGSPVPDGTAFRVKLPNGMIISSTDDSFVSVIYNVDGTANIIIDTQGLTDRRPTLTQCMINLGDINDGFAVSAQEAGKGESAFTPFSANPRVNYYMEDKTLDFTGVRRSLFSIEKGTALSDISKHIVFPTNETIAVTYNGRTGLNGAVLREAFVTEWHIDGSADTSLPDTAGTEVTLVGLLADAEYPNMGLVQNPDGRELRLVIVIGDSTYVPDTEKIRVTTNDVVELDENNGFVFDTISTVMPFTPQLQTFTIENIGTADIDGLGVSINNTSPASGGLYFILECMPDTVLAQGDTTDFIIRPVSTLLPGTYTADVVISSKHGELKRFEIRVTVTDKELHTVNASVNDANLGRVTLKYGSKYAEGETVHAKVTLFDSEYSFVRWEYSPDITISDDGSGEYTFTMPDSDVKLVAILEESLFSKLRIEDLQVRNNDDSINQLRDSSLNAVSFDSKVLEYTVVVPYETEEAKVYFKPRNTEIDNNPITVSVTYTDGSSIAYTFNTADGYYRSDLFNLTVTPVNKITVSQAYGDETRSYVVNIIRRNKIHVTLLNGNSPYGLIESDTRWSDADKAAAKAEFDANHRYGDTYVPEKAVHTAATMYYEDAWKNTANCDKDASALFVYENTEFTDPGFVDLQNADGEPVSESDVTRQLVLDELIGDDNTDLPAYLNSVAPLTVTAAGTSGAAWKVTDILHKKIRPGIYKLEYIFTDSDGWISIFRRPVIILAKKGDADIDNSVSMTDSNSLYSRAATGLSQKIFRSGESWSNIYAYRVCDVNEDRNVNGVDANMVKSHVSRGAALSEFYEELSTE